MASLVKIRAFFLIFAGFVLIAAMHDEPFKMQRLQKKLGAGQIQITGVSHL